MVYRPLVLVTPPYTRLISFEFGLENVVDSIGIPGLIKWYESTQGRTTRERSAVMESFSIAETGFCFRDLELDTCILRFLDRLNFS
jgi:hypothetical protein